MLISPRFAEAEEVAVISAGDAGGWNVLPYLDLIAWAEGTSTSPATKNDGYDVIVTGHDKIPTIFTDYSDHPFDGGRPRVIVRPAEDGKPELESTASGRYQIELFIWREYHPMLGLTEFTPLSQDIVACRLMRERGALHFLEAGDIASAINACAPIWASFPGNNYKQNPKPIYLLIKQFQILKGKYNGRSS